MSTGMWLAVLVVAALGLVAALIDGRARSGRRRGRGPRRKRRP